MSERDSQISSLLEKLQRFNQQYEDLQKFVSEGNELLAQEKPVGEDAARVQQQMDTCQVSRGGKRGEGGRERGGGVVINGGVKYFVCANCS